MENCFSSLTRYLRVAAIELRGCQDRSVHPDRKAAHRLLPRHAPVQKELPTVDLFNPFRMTLCLLRQRIRDNPYVFRIGAYIRKRSLEPDWPFDNGLHRSQITHALLRFDPRAARLAPPRAVENADLNTKFTGPLQCGVHHAPPLRRKERMLPVRLVTDADIADKSAVDPHRLHGLEITNHPFLGDIVGYPVPIHANGISSGTFRNASASGPSKGYRRPFRNTTPKKPP